MHNLILFDGPEWSQLLPLTYTRPVAGIRIGILTITEKWERQSGGTVSYQTQTHLEVKFPSQKTAENLYINGGICPTPELWAAIQGLQLGESLMQNDVRIAANAADWDAIDWSKSKNFEGAFLHITQLWHIFQYNGAALEADYQMLTAGRTSAPISNTNTVLGNRVFLEPGAKVEAAILNSTSGPIYIGNDAEIMEGSVVRGPFALCDHSQLKLATKIYGPTTVGPHSKVGGEVNNSVIFGYSNKGHDGFLGNAVLGEWCNIGADSNNSNLKNNYDEVRLWNYASGSFQKTGLQFCGLFMGDHSKCGINTMFNTGTVVGVSANIFGAGFPRNFIQSFSWGGAAGLIPYKLDKALETAARVMERRGIPLDDTEINILKYVYEQDGLK